MWSLLEFGDKNKVIVSSRKEIIKIRIEINGV